MARFSLIGSSNAGQAFYADAQRTINWYKENAEDISSKTAAMLLPTPGLKTFATLPGTQVRGLFNFNGRVFGVSDTTFAEILASGTLTNQNTLPTTTGIVTFAANQANQLMFVSAGLLYIFNTATNTLSQPAAAPTGISQIGFSDGFFVALTGNSNTFQLSASLDGTTWSALNVGKPSVFPDNIVSMVVDHREICLMGNKQSVFYYDSGNTFPYDVVPGGFMETGCVATFATAKLDNSFFWLGQDERGQGIAWRSQGYSPARVSKHAEEYRWSLYPRISDCISYSYQDQGHTFWHLYFPSGIQDSGLPLGASWRYDVDTGEWHEVAFWDNVNGRYTAHRSQCHAMGFGLHLVGDWLSGNVYQMQIPTLSGQAWSFADDFGNPIVRTRRSQHISIEKQWMFHQMLQVDADVGLGPQPPLTGTAAPTSFFLTDANKVLWQVGVNAVGSLVTSHALAGATPVSMILTDFSANTSWQFGITTLGVITLTKVPTLPLYPFANSMVGTDGATTWRLTVRDLGGGTATFVTTSSGPVIRDPQLFLRWSDDGGNTWSNIHTLNAGQTGNYKKRIILRRLGRSRDRIYEISASDPIPWRIVDAYLSANPGYQPQERITDELRKKA